MSKKVAALIAETLPLNSRVRAATADAVKAFDAESNPSGDLALSRDVGFLIEVGLCDVDTAPGDRASAEQLLRKHIQPVLQLKRFCAFYLGEVLMVANPYGVITYNTYSELPLSGYSSVQFVRMCSTIRDELGAEYTGGRDRLYAYTLHTEKKVA